MLVRCFIVNIPAIPDVLADAAERPDHPSLIVLRDMIAEWCLLKRPKSFEFGGAACTFVESVQEGFQVMRMIAKEYKYNRDVIESMYFVSNEDDSELMQNKVERLYALYNRRN